MQRVNYYVASSLDGFIADKNHGFGAFLHEGAHTTDYFEALRTFDSVVMGRRTYEVGTKMGVTDPYPFLRTFVASRSLPRSEDPNVTVLADDVVGAVRRLRAEPGRGIYLCGGGDLAGQFLGAGLVDELTLKLNPLLLGDGIPLVRGLARSIALELMECKPYPNGVVVLRYLIPTGAARRP